MCGGKKQQKCRGVCAWQRQREGGTTARSSSSLQHNHTGHLHLPSSTSWPASTASLSRAASMLLLLRWCVRVWRWRCRVWCSLVLLALLNPSLSSAQDNGTIGSLTFFCAPTARYNTVISQLPLPTSAFLRAAIRPQHLHHIISACLEDVEWLGGGFLCALR